jgi:hypothetical protein
MMHKQKTCSVAKPIQRSTRPHALVVKSLNSQKVAALVAGLVVLFALTILGWLNTGFAISEFKMGASWKNLMSEIRCTDTAFNFNSDAMSRNVQTCKQSSLVVSFMWNS